MAADASAGDKVGQSTVHWRGRLVIEGELVRGRGEGGRHALRKDRDVADTCTALLLLLNDRNFRW